MKLLQPGDSENQTLQSLSAIIRIGFVFLFWLTVAVIVGCAGYFIIKVAVSILHMLLKAVGQI